MRCEAAEPCFEPAVVRVSVGDRKGYVLCAGHAMSNMRVAEITKQFGVVIEFEMIQHEVEAR